MISPDFNIVGQEDSRDIAPRVVFKRIIRLAVKSAILAAVLCAVFINIVDACLDCGLDADCFYIRTHDYSTLRILSSLLRPAMLMVGAGFFAYALYHWIVFQWRQEEPVTILRFIAAGVVFGAVCACGAIFLELNSWFSGAWKARFFSYNLLSFFFVFLVYGGLFGWLNFSFLKTPAPQKPKNTNPSPVNWVSVPLGVHILLNFSASILSVFFGMFLVMVAYMTGGCLSGEAVFTCAADKIVDAGAMLVVLPVLAVIVGHVVSPLLYIIYCPITRIFWTGGYRHFLFYVFFGGTVSYMNSLIFAAVENGSLSRAGPLEAFSLIYIISGLMTGALHWLFLTRAQRKLEKQKADDTP